MTGILHVVMFIIQMLVTFSQHVAQFYFEISS